MGTKTEEILRFLRASGNKHLTSLYTPEMEVQVNVARGEGKPVSGIFKGKQWRAWTDGTTNWKSFRIPWNAKIDPEYTDSELNFSLASHAEAVGMTGWNWAQRQSLWVGFDFDSIIGHKQGLTDEELDELQDKIMQYPYATLVRSTGGRGLHLYIHFASPVDTGNHVEHAALARAILTRLSSDIGYNFMASVDCCGGILWVYHRKQEGTNGLSLLKQGQKFPVANIPTNWKSHVEVTSKKRRKIKTIASDGSAFSELISSVKTATLDDEHLKILKWISENGKYDNWWDSDHNMLVCHTKDLESCHKELSLKGIFYTNSTASTPQNCFVFPTNTSSGAWIVRRHSLRVQEHPSWVVDPSGWTRCVFNDIAEFESCCKANNGIENVRGEYVFQQAKDGLQAIKDLDILNVFIPPELQFRQFTLKEKSDGKVILSVRREANDPPIEHFLPNKKGDLWERVIHRAKKKKEVNAPDFLIRHVISQDTEAGWWIYARDKWVQQNKSNVNTVLLSQQEAQNKLDVELLMAKAILNPWELINEPFQEVYPGNRQWNKAAASLSCEPIEGEHPTWDSILSHCGSCLDEVVSADPWCADNGLSTGADYLIHWIASMFQFPREPLPYLFLYGEQNTGKSTLHEALNLLFRQNRGYVRADNALINQQGFNSEIANAVLCVVEETNVSKHKDAANRIKDWVTGKTISINTKYKVVYDIGNSTHWIQCANDPGYCPVFPGDTRITVIRVPGLKNEIGKIKLFEMLEQEKAAFLFTVMNIDIPDVSGRLRIPCLSSIEKQNLEQSNMSELEMFFSECVVEAHGYCISFDELFNAFVEWLPADRRGSWGKIKFSREIPRSGAICKAPYGAKNIMTVGNIALRAFYPEPELKNSTFYVNAKGRLETK